ncbi:hypothetical protein AVEN_72318-1 [Araneus ventricosus]|uniref:Uncharacterized protein n=1 Tax=Araneus ventricosus TaxID=182803 RepID=A0A4Y2NMU6_ARAVE|nr:hypothetical protein AVEN_72318-1 [Araneus ventricosus]
MLGITVQHETTYSSLSHDLTCLSCDGVLISFGFALTIVKVPLLFRTSGVTFPQPSSQTAKKVHISLSIGSQRKHFRANRFGKPFPKIDEKEEHLQPPPYQTDCRDNGPSEDAEESTRPNSFQVTPYQVAALTQNLA